jgi:hypothetical protein
VWFREYMTKGQMFGRVGDDRQSLYCVIVCSEGTLNPLHFQTVSFKGYRGWCQKSERQRITRCIEDLRGCLSDVVSPKAEETIAITDVFIPFNEAHPLTKKLRMPTVELLSSPTISKALLFTFFLATTFAIYASS